jgi:hypothetical protein
MSDWEFTCAQLRWGFIVINGLLAVTVMAPIFWHLWINTGVANSNFYYAITLVYTATQVGHNNHAWHLSVYHIELFGTLQAPTSGV